MGLKARIRAVVRLENGGPRNKNVLRTLARTPLQVEQFERIFDAMLASRELVMYSDKRHAVWAEIAEYSPDDPHRILPCRAWPARRIESV